MSSLNKHAADLHQRALVWDNHGCLPMVNAEQWFPQLERYHAAGVDVAMINIGDSDFLLESLMRMAAGLRHYINRHPDKYVLAVTVEAIRRAKAQGKLAVGLNVEGVFSIGEQLSLVEFYHHIGVRWMLMVYNRQNPAGSGVHDPVDGGLTKFGHQVVAEMDRVGIIKCCSHTGYKTALDIFAASTKPTIFSHSNPRALQDHPRNIPDELIYACAETGGVVGVNGVGLFLGDPEATSQTFVNHVDYLVQRIGINHVGIGLDYVFDRSDTDSLTTGNTNYWPSGNGYDQKYAFVPPEQLPEITEELLRRGYKDEDVRAVLGENLLRVAEAVWK